MSDDLAVLPVRDGDSGGDDDVPRVDSPGGEKDGEAHAGDAGPEGCADAGPEVVVAAAEPARVSSSCMPSAMMFVTASENILAESPKKCDHCGLVIVLQVRRSEEEEFANYHMVHADCDHDGSHVCCMLVRCDVVDKRAIDDHLRELPFEAARVFK